MNHTQLMEQLNRQIRGCFGDQDRIFAGHPLDEKRAKELRRFAKENGASLADVEQAANGFLNGCIQSHIDEQMIEVRKFFSKQLD